MYSEDKLVSVSLEQLETAYNSAGTVTVTGNTVTSTTTNNTSSTYNDSSSNNNNDKYKGYNNDPSWIPSKSTTSNIKTEKRSYNNNGNDEEEDVFDNLKFKKKGVSKPYVRPERNNSNSCNSNGNNGNTTGNSGGRPTTAYSKVCIYYSTTIEYTKPIRM